MLVYAGAKSAWSPLTPSLVPVPGYRLIPTSFKAVEWTLLAMPADGGNGSFVFLSATNSSYLVVSFSVLCDNHVPDYTYRPEEASTSNITDVWMTVEVLVQELSQVLAVLADVLHQVLFLHDRLDLQCGCTAYRMTLVGVSMGKSTG